MGGGNSPEGSRKRNVDDNNSFVPKALMILKVLIHTSIQTTS
jgi:hypothetical protein